MAKLPRIGVLVVFFSLGVAILQRQGGRPGLQLSVPAWMTDRVPPGLASFLGLDRPDVELFDTPCHCGVRQLYSRPLIRVDRCVVSSMPFRC